ncbi:MAG: hypothetical protein AAF576_03580 [Pseudomonadota bacterium]
MRLVLHIGAHRTGSTLVERMLSSLATARPDLGLTVWKPKYLRAIPGFKHIPNVVARAKRGDDAAELRCATLRFDLAERMEAAAAQGTKVLVLSEENMSGGMKPNLRDGQFYAGVRARLESYAHVLGRAPDRVALGIREYGAVWNSAYGYLQRGYNDLPPADKAGRGLLEARRGWPALASAAGQVWPTAEILVWRQEDLAENAERIAAKVGDVPEEHLQRPDEEDVNTTRAMGRPVQLFSPAERRKLKRRYDHHITRMRDEGRVTWAVTPEPAL